MLKHHTITYLEFPAQNLEATQAFFSQVFQWDFQQWGPDYCAHTSATVEVGFYRAPLTSVSSQGGAMAVFYSENLEASEAAVRQAEGVISKATFDFPGGRRFHFIEPSGNEFAVWSDITVDGTQSDHG
ncbi:MAG: VOC family protein [Reinekea sp.]|jgi:predicted enzyme related to lactoylglutathione lyase|nr:VOC family protein [Reinekea sp.]